jgi:hypothetical protein
MKSPTVIAGAHIATRSIQHRGGRTDKRCSKKVNGTAHKAVPISLPLKWKGSEFLLAIHNRHD